MIMQCNNASIEDFDNAISNSEQEPKEITIDYILRIVCVFFEAEKSFILENTNKEENVRPRQIAHYYARLLTNKSLRIIGQELGSKDHATVLHSCKTISNLIETDKKFREKTIKPINHLLCIY